MSGSKGLPACSHAFSIQEFIWKPARRTLEQYLDRGRRSECLGIAIDESGNLQAER
jgi:hypothetical protein